MNLGAVNLQGDFKDPLTLIRRMFGGEYYFTRWVEHPSSSILHHDNSCCEIARSWFLAYARSMEIDSLSQYQLKAPTWLSQMFTWGPSAWPISWCQLVKKKVIDCGVFAALSREVFRAQGYEVHPAQALLSYNETCTHHWKDLWKNNEQADTVFPWIGNEIVYHELCVVEMSSGLAKVYDSTWGNWYEPHQRVGYGAVLAMRVECPRLLHWGDKVFSWGEWIIL